MSTPLSIEGISWRPAAMADIPAIVDLAAAVDSVERLELAGGPEHWKWWLGQQDLGNDTLLAEDPDGNVVALGGSYPTDSELGARAILWLDSHPDRLDLEKPLLEWAAERGREQIEASDHPEKMIRIGVEEHRIRRRALLESHGFGIARAFVNMARPLEGDLPEPRPLPDGTEVVPWTPELDEQARLVSNAAFAGHWGSLPMDAETWSSMVLDEIVRRDLSFVALDGQRAVAICLAEVDPEDDEHDLWISRVGTHPDRQRTGLASHLLTRTMRAGAEAGLRTTSLDVDEESRFDATAIYSGLGYRVAARSLFYVLGTG